MIGIPLSRNNKMLIEAFPESYVGEKFGLDL